MRQPTYGPAPDYRIVTVFGADNEGIEMGDRIETTAGHVGTVTGFSLTPLDRVRVSLDEFPGRLFFGADSDFRRLVMMTLFLVLGACNPMAPPVPIVDAATEAEARDMAAYALGLSPGHHAPTSDTVGALRVYGAPWIVVSADTVTGTLYWHEGSKRFGLCDLDLRGAQGWACGYNVGNGS